MRKIEFSKRYLKSLKKLNKNEQAEVNALIKRLANDENLELKYKDHQLLGEFKNFRYKKRYSKRVFYAKRISKNFAYFN